MADEQTVLEPMTDNHEAQEHADESPEPVEHALEAESEAAPDAPQDEAGADGSDGLHVTADAEAEGEAEAAQDEYAENVAEQEAEAEFELDDDDDARSSRRSSTSSSSSSDSDRRTSMRTEALIAAAARAVVAKINGHEDGIDDFSILNSIPDPEAMHEEDGSPATHEEEEEEEEAVEHAAAAAGAVTGAVTGADEEVDYDQDGEEEEDAVFSDRSQRTSLASFEHNSGASNNGSEYDQQKCGEAPEPVAAENECEQEQEQEQEHAHEDEQEQEYAADTGDVSYHEDHRSSRGSGVSAGSAGSKGPRVSGISHMSQYDRHHRSEEESQHGGEDYIPHTTRGTPRALQMSSPSPSAIFGVSPRSAARRRRAGTGEGMDDGRRSMGSVGTYSSLPNSPSKRSTPTRFKVFRRPEPAPLVLLHATIMPTRWGWSDVMSNLDEMMSRSLPKRKTSDFPIETKAAKSSAADNVPTDLSTFEPSAALKRLHTAWCQLQEYSLGADTVTERGVLLPHPQNDYEVLEERLLEALELPVRRRARILECGHYLGPADADDDDDEDYDCDNNEHSDEADEDGTNKRHWCPECRSEIRYESLGAERVFRVKVYASNGLMTVGAWDACWREMERVDVEIEPIVADVALQRELTLLRSLQQQDAYRREEEERRALYAEEEEEELEEEEEEVEDEHEEIAPEQDEHFETRSTAGHFQASPPRRTTTSSNHGPPEAEHWKNEGDEYGNTPPQAETPSSPSAEAYERREERRQSQYSTGPMDKDVPGYGGPAPAYPPPPAAHPNDYQHGHPQNPYESASLAELLMAAVRVFLRDRKHVAITVLSIIVIVLATLRAPSAGVDGAMGMPPPSSALAHHAAVHNYNHESVAHAVTTAASVETVVEKTTVKVVETVTEVATETATETATEMETATTTANQLAIASTTQAPVAEAELYALTTELVAAPQPEEMCPTMAAILFAVVEEPMSPAVPAMLALSA